MRRCITASPVGEKQIAQRFDILDFAAEFAFAAQALGGLDEEFFQQLVHQGFRCGRGPAR